MSQFTLDTTTPLWYNDHMKNNTKRTQRSPEEIIAETEARLERLRLRQAKSEAKSDPAVQKLIAQKEDAQKDLREIKKLLGSGPQSSESRIRKHEAWIEKILGERAEAEVQLAYADERALVADLALSDHYRKISQ